MDSPKEFWINFSGKKFNLNEINGGDGKGALDREENLKLLFDFFDVDSSGELEEKEVVALINKINQYAKKDGNSIFSAKEEEDFLYETREYADKSGGKIVKSLKDIGITRDQLVKFIEPIYKNFGKFNGIPHYELEAINFLSTAVNNGEQDLEAYNETRGVISKSVNLWRSVFNQENTRSEVEYSIKTTQEHVKSLTNAAKKSEKEFNKTYRNLRGVSFDSQAIEECTTKSKVYTSAKTTYDMVSYIKGNMLYHNQLMNGHAVIPVQAASSIMDALEMCGIKDINQINILLHNISEKNKNNPEFSRYGGNLRLSKTKNGNWEIYRDTPTGYPDTATPEQLNFVVHEILEMLEKQLALAFYAAPDSDNKDVLLQKAKNVFSTQEVMNLDKAYGQLAFNATTRGLTAEEFQLYTEIAKYKGMNDREYSELVNKLLDNMNPNEIDKLNANILNYYKTEYEEAYAAAYGGEDPSKMAQIYIEKEQQGVQYIQMGLNIASMALMFIPGGAIASAPGWLAKGIKTAKAVTPFLMVTHPLDFLEKWTSNGISEQEFNEWFMSCAESAVFMAVGMGVGKVAECFSSVYKTKALVTFLKNSGKSVDEITSIIKANPLKFPQEVVEGLEHIDKVAKTLQISTEVAMDLSSTYALTKQMHGEGLTTFDWIQSVASAVAGSTLQKQFAPMSTEAKIDFLVKAFEDFNLSRDDAARILIEMDKVSAGEYNTHKTKSKTEFGSGSKVQEGAVLNEVVVKSDDATSAKSAGMKNVTDEFDMYLQGLKEHGNDFVPEFSDGTDPLLKEFCEYRAKNAKELSDRGIKVNYDKSRLGILSDFLMYIYSENKNISKESLSRIHDEIAKLMPEYMKTKFPNVRPEIAENADKIYKWKIAMSGQTSALKPDVNGVYAVINSKSFDAEAHNKAVKEFTEFLENMTGKKVLVGDSARFNEFVNMIGAFNNPDLYKDVDYIVLGHGVGSSLETDSSNSRVWRFKHSGEPVWQYIADNVPKGKKALLFVCDTALNPANRKNMPEMYDEKGVFMDAIGVPASGIDKSPAKIVISGINHVVGSVSAKSNGKPKYLINGAIGGEVTVTAYSLKDISISSRIDLQNGSYTTYTDKNGNKVYKVVATATQNPRNGGWDYTYNVYKVDENGMIIEELNGVTDKEIKKVFGKFKNEQIHDNPGADNSGYAYSGMPIFRTIANIFKGRTETDIEPRTRNLDVNAPRTHMDYSQYPEEVRLMISQACDELKMNDNFFSDDNYIMSHFLEGVETNSIIFRDKSTLKAYLEHCRNMHMLVNKQGKSIFTKQYYNQNSGNVELRWDDDLVKDVAILMVSDPKMHESLGNLVGLFMDGGIDEFSFRTMIHYVKKGYISASTIDISLKSLITTDGGENVGTYYIESLLMADKSMVGRRRDIIDYLGNSDPEIKNILQTLKTEIGDEIFDLRWECVPYDDKSAIMNFIKDAKNIIYIRKTMLGPQNYQIRIPGWNSNNVWLHDIPEISNTAATMLDEGVPFDDVMSWVALSYRELDTKIVTKATDQYKLEASGLLRCDRDGYLCDNRHYNMTSMTGFGYTDIYGINYVDRFRAVDVWNGRTLHVPEGYNIELTRISVNETEIRPEEYNPQNHNHTVKTDVNGVRHYYEISGKMNHPAGRCVNNALDIVNSIQDMLMEKYHGKNLTEADMNDINENIGEIHWLLSHSMPWGRGSAGISDAYVKALYKALGIQLSQPRRGVSFDLEAFCTELEDYRKNYKNLYERAPRYVG